MTKETDSKPQEGGRSRGKSRRRGKAELELDQERCKDCGICVAFCPKGVLAQDEYGNVYIEDEEKCVLCGNCEIFCPEFAITVKEAGGNDEVPEASTDAGE